MKMTYTANSYKGEMTARQLLTDGYQGDIKITYSGRKIGTCAATENTALQAKTTAKTTTNHDHRNIVTLH